MTLPTYVLQLFSLISDDLGGVYHLCYITIQTGSILTRSTQTSACKTFPENWDSKGPSIGTLLAYVDCRDHGLNYIF